MRYTIENEQMKVEVESTGAELKSVYGKQTKIEYMWKADPAYYGRTSPNLFPIVGSLRDEQYRYEGKTYKMKQHGFVRDMEWDMHKESDTTLICSVQSNESTRENYPFDFTMQLIYAINGNRLKVTWKIQNAGNKTMYFSCGFHPCFSCPVHGEDSKVGYAYDFHVDGNITYRGNDAESGLLIKQDKELCLENGKAVFTPDFFDYETYVVENNQTQEMSLVDTEGKAYLNVYFDAPLFGLWSAECKNAPYVAIEPWFGRCDALGFDGSLEEREWGNALNAQEEFEHAYEIEIVE